MQQTKSTMNPAAAPRMTMQGAWLAALLTFPALAAAQSAGPVAPDAGAILRQLVPSQPADASPSGTGLKVEQQGAAALPPSAPFEVKLIRLSGNTLFDTAVLHALVADGEGRRLSLAQLGELAARITAYYRDRGYPLARAIIPAQAIEHGVVRIEVVEARYGRVDLDNRSRVKTALLEATLAPLRSGEMIGQDGMDRALLLLSDVPGIAIDATLKPGESVGTSDLRVEASPEAAVSGNAVLDNNGNRYTGRARLGATLHVNNPLGQGDVLSVGVLSSGSGLHYGRLGYDFLLNGQGTRLGGTYSALRYRLGGALAPLDASGSAHAASLWARHPLVRSRDVNLYTQLQYDRLRLRDGIGAGGIRNDRHLENWNLGLSGDVRDGFLGGGISTWNATWTTGRVGFDDAWAQASDAATARTAGGFSKWQAGLARLQRLTAKDSLYLSLSGQWANGNLDSSQKMSVGGPYSVRAYDLGAVSADAGGQASVEWRRELGSAGGGHLQAAAFIDSARVTVNRNAWGAGINHATLSGAGLGLGWAGAKRMRAKAYVAAPLGSAPAGVSRSVRAWVEIGMGF